MPTVLTLHRGLPLTQKGSSQMLLYPQAGRCKTHNRYPAKWTKRLINLWIQIMQPA